MSLLSEKGAKLKTKIISGIITVFVLALLILSGPAQAITVGVTSISNTRPIENTDVTFLTKIDLHSSDTVPLIENRITIRNSDTGVVRAFCDFELDGENDCTGFDIELVTSWSNYNGGGETGSTQGYGYDFETGITDSDTWNFDYGYENVAGYGYSSYTDHVEDNDDSQSAEYIYRVTWTTPNVARNTDFDLEMSTTVNDGDVEVRFEDLSPPTITVRNSGGGTTGGSTSSDTPTDEEGETYEIPLEDFESEDGYIANNLKKGDKLQVMINGEQHTVTILSITGTSVIVVVASTPQEAELDIGETKNFELTQDNFYDLSVTLNSITDGQASITVKSIHEQMGSDGTVDGDDTTPPADEEGNLLWLWILIGIVVLVVAIAAVLGKKK